MVEGGGFEPPKDEPTDLQSVPFGHSGTPPMPFRKRVFSTKISALSTLKSLFFIASVICQIFQ